MSNLVKLLELRISNFRSFQEEQTIDFSNLSHLIQINGYNLDTGGSSGAGKSSVFLALDYALGFCDLPTTALQSWNSKEKISVTAKLEVNGEVFSITRTNKTGNILTIQTETETISGSSSLAEEKLDSILQIDRKLFQKISHKKQKEGGFFLSMTPKEMYLFLIQMLKLDSVSDKVLLIDEDIKNNKSLILRGNSELEAYKSNLLELKNLLDTKQKPVFDKDLPDLIAKNDTIVSDVTQKIKDLSSTCDSQIKLIPIPQKLSTDTTLLETQKAGLQKQIDIFKTDLQKDLSVLQKEKTVINLEMQQNLSKINECVYAEKEIQSIPELVKKLKAEKEKIQKHTCPTCEQDWNNEKSKLKEAEIDTQLENLKKKAIALKAIISEKSNLNSYTLILQERLKENENKSNVCREKYSQDVEIIEKNKQKVESEIQNILLSINNKYLKEKESYQKSVSELLELYSTEKLKNDLNQLVNKNNLYKQELINSKKMLELFETETKKLSTLIEEKQIQVDHKQLELDSLNQKNIIAEETKRFLKHYIMNKFSDTLDTIGNVATDLISDISNMKNASIYFEKQKETQSGKVKDEVTPILSKGENIDIPIKAISGGERTAIDLAVDLAVIDTIEKQSSCGCDFYIIDEPFDGLDNICREDVLSVLEKFDTNKKIILVDHSEELKQIVNQKITIKKENNVSTVE